jgi:hypothetical protein
MPQKAQHHRCHTTPSWKAYSIRLRIVKNVHHFPFRGREQVLEIAICDTPPEGTGGSVAAQVRTFHFLVCAERVAFIMQDDSAGLKDVAVMGNLQCEISVLFDEENRNA